MKVSDLFVKTLEAEGVEYIFGGAPLLVALTITLVATTLGE